MSASPVRAWLAKHTPLSPGLLQTADFAASMAARMRARSMADEQAYAALLSSDPSEAVRLQCAVAVPESWLFRYRTSFALLRRWLVERRATASRQLAMLSAPCASGAEAYALAATAAAAGWPAERFAIDAFDLSPELVEAARTGRCRGATLREGVPDWAEPWFDRDGGDAVLRTDLLERIRFQASDLRTAEFRAGGYDAVLCRNLLIYLSGPARREVVDRLAGGLREGGLLLVGHADATVELLERFESVEPTAFAFRPLRARQETARKASSSRSSGTGVPRRDVRFGPATTEPPASSKRPSLPATPAPAAGPTQTRRGPSPAPSADALTQAIASGDARAIGSVAREVLDRRPDDLRALLVLVEQRLTQDDREAERLCRRIVYLDPDNERALVVLAELADRQGRSAEADRFRRRALRAHLRAAGSQSDDDDGTRRAEAGQTT